MKRCLIFGKPNIGKTSFFLNFAEYLGVKKYNIKSIYHDGNIKNKDYLYNVAKEYLTSSYPYKTTCLQSLEVEISFLRKKKQLELIDSMGLVEGIHPSLDMRRAMVQTLKALQDCEITFHMIDITQWKLLDKDDEDNNIDVQLAKYQLFKESNSIILANRVDLLDSNSPIISLQKKFPNHYIIPISNITRQGFGELKTYLKRRL